jgi:hypothetical protein
LSAVSEIRGLHEKLVPVHPEYFST